MSTAQMTRPPQTLYVSIRRDELRQLKAERDQLQQEVLRLRSHLQGQLDQPSSLQPALC
jgi:cell division protein FtsB